MEAPIAELQPRSPRRLFGGHALSLEPLGQHLEVLLDLNIELVLLRLSAEKP